MTESWIDRAIDNRWLMMLLAIAVCIAGGWAFFQQPIDAYPDISSEAVTIITTFPGRATEEVERQVTIPVEIAMRGRAARSDGRDLAPSSASRSCNSSSRRGPKSIGPGSG